MHISLLRVARILNQFCLDLLHLSKDCLQILMADWISIHSICQLQYILTQFYQCLGWIKTCLSGINFCKIYLFRSFINTEGILTLAVS